MSEPLDPRLEQARYGSEHSGDRFVGFWLDLFVAARNRRHARREITGLLGEDAGAAIEALGPEPVLAELRDAARVYVNSCLGDPSFGTTLFGFKRLGENEVRGRLATETVAALEVLAASGLGGPAAALPDALIGGYRDALGPDSIDALRAAASQSPAVASFLQAW